MELILAGRGRGKTTMLLDWLRKNPAAVMLCDSELCARRLRDDNPDIAPGRFLILDELRSLRGRSLGLQVGIDNLDLVLPQLIGAPVGVVTCTP